jgi:hypothetical protein
VKIAFLVTLDVSGGAVDLETIRRNLATAIERQRDEAGLSADDDEGMVEGVEVRYQPGTPQDPDPLNAPARDAVLRCVDAMGNTAFVRHTSARGWACTLSNGIPASMSYAGVPHGEETATVVALGRAKTVGDVLRIMKARAQQARSIELEA